MIHKKLVNGNEWITVEITDEQWALLPMLNETVARELLINRELGLYNNICRFLVSLMGQGYDLTLDQLKFIWYSEKFLTYYLHVDSNEGYMFQWYNVIPKRLQGKFV